VLKQKNEDFEGDALQLQHTTVAAQPSRAKLKLEILAEPDRGL
jgi:hypothetical protein